MEIETIEDPKDITITPEKSVNDRNEYRYVQFKNGVKALLISCPLNVYKDIDFSGPYTAEDGPPFLKYGATSRAKNMADEVFFKNVPKTTESEANEETTDEIDKYYEEKMNLEEEGDGDQVQEQDNADQILAKDQSPCKCEEDKDLAEKEAVDLISSFKNEECCGLGAELLEEEFPIEEIDNIRDALVDSMDWIPRESEDEFGYSQPWLDPIAIANGLISVDPYDIAYSKDDVAKQAFFDNDTKTAKNCVVSITFPTGALLDHKYAVKGLTDLSRHVIQDGSIISARTGLDLNMSTFAHVCKAKDNTGGFLQRLKGAFSPDINSKYINCILDSNYPYLNSIHEEIHPLDYSSPKLSDRKQLQFIYGLAKEGHPFKSVSPDFYLGLAQNKPEKSLKDLDCDLMRLWRSDYCADIASLVIQASESLDSLEKIVRNEFENIPRPPFRKTENHSEWPFEEDVFKHLYKISYRDGEKYPTLLLSWALNPCLWKNYKGKPMEYVAWLLNHKLKGGLYSALVQKQFITDIQAGCNRTGYHRNDYCSLFQIFIQLTEKGADADNIRTVVRTLFLYINYLKFVTPNQELFNALKFSREVTFNSNEQETNSLRNLQVPFGNVTSPQPNICALGEAMCMLSQEDIPNILSADIRFFEHQETEIDNFLTSLDIDKCIFMLSCRKLESFGMIEEPYYKSKYYTTVIPDTWKSGDEDSNDPIANITANFDVPKLYELFEKSLRTDLDPEKTEPDDIEAKIFLNDPSKIIWNKTNQNYKETVSYTVHFAAPLLNEFQPKRAVMVALMAKKLNNTCGYISPYQLTNLHWSIEPTLFGVLIKVFGHGSQANFALNWIVARYNSAMSYIQKNVEKIKNLVLEDYRSALSSPECLARCVYNYISVRNYIPLRTRLNTLEDMNTKSFNDEISAFIQSFSTGCLVLGRCCTGEIAAMQETLPNNLVVLEPIKPQILSYMWPTESKIIRLVSESVKPENVYVHQHFQLQLATAETKAFANILLDIVRMELSISRNDTKMQKLYIEARINELNGVMDFELIASTSKINVDEVEIRLEDFMDSMHKFIKMNKDSFGSDYESIIQSLGVKRSCGPSFHSIINEIHEYERKVKDFTFSFKQIPLEGGLYNCIDPKKFYEWFVANFHEKTKTRKMTIEIVSSLVTSEKNDEVRSKKRKIDEGFEVIEPKVYSLWQPNHGQQASLFIEDIELFKNGLDYYRLDSLKSN